MANRSSENDTAILVVSCDKFEDLWRPFFSCLFKYWPDCPYPVYLGTNHATYTDARVRSITVGDDVDYSSNLLTMLDAVEQDWVILWIEDLVVSAPVETARVLNVVRKAQDERAAYLKLIANHPFAYGVAESSEFGEVPRGTAYRVCITVGLWRKEVLKKLIRRGESAWDLERNGTVRSNDTAEKFFALSVLRRRRPLFSIAHIIIKGRVNRDARAFLEKEGMLHSVRRRRTQSIRSWVYVRGYVGLHDLRSRAKMYLNRLARAAGMTSAGHNVPRG